MINEFKSKVFLVRNWMGGSNVLSGLKASLEGSNVSIICPEVDAWEKGIVISCVPEEINIKFDYFGKIYFFRNADVCMNFLKKNYLTSENVNIVVQIRHPLDLLIAEFYGDTLRHFAPKGNEVTWSKLRKDYIKEGVEAFCKRRALELELSFLKYEQYRECISVISYEEMVLNPQSYVEELFGFLELLPIDQFQSHIMIDAIDINGGHINTQGKRRMNSKLEWPFPGRSAWILKNRLIIEIMSLMVAYISFFESVDKNYDLIKPPMLARKVPTFLMKIICLYRFQIKPWFKDVLSKY